MSMERDAGMIIPTCDICNERLDGYDEFSEAVQGKKANGWHSKKIYGEWMDFCPTCWGIRSERDD